MINLSDISGISSKRMLQTFIDKHCKGEVDDFVKDLSKSISQLLYSDLKAAGKPGHKR